MKYPLYILTASILLAGTWAYAGLETKTINACVSKVGTVRIIPGGSPIQCLKHETLLTWNTSGPKGDQGEPGPQGPAGEPAPRGAGNIAFISHIGNQVLTKDGIVYSVFTPHENNGNTQWMPTTNFGGDQANINPPMPVEDIVEWQVDMLLDRSGNVWRYESNGTWVNVGHP